MKGLLLPAVVLLLLSGTGCSDAGPVQTASDEVDAGKADSVTAEIRMGAGELHLEGGTAKLLSASYQYSERVGRPTVHYDLAGEHGKLTVASPSGTSTGKVTNNWNLKMGSDAPLEITIALGAGEAQLDMSQLPLRSAVVNIGAGEMRLNVAGHYKSDVAVQVNGGVGEARISLPKDVGAVVEAAGGLGGISTNGLTKHDDGKYYNAAYAEEKPAVRVSVHGGVGNITLSVAD